MDPADFVSDAWGDIRRTPGEHGYHAYYPKSLGRPLDLGRETVALQSKADLALGRLAGAGRILPSTAILLAPYALQESLDSSRIEGTQTTLSDVLSAKATGERAGVDVREVLNYSAALDHGITSPLPLSKRLLCEMHAILLADVRGQEKTPGQFRRTQNWIGSRDIDNARFVPPPVTAMQAALDDWESYQHEDDGLPLLIRCGLLHYQFETIHPFLDGNGRLGRLFITLFLIDKGPLTAPLLYVSSYFEATKEEYYDRLQAVRERGDMAGWLNYFLRAVAAQSEDAVDKAERLMDIRERYRGLVQSRTKGRAIEVVDLILENPVLTARLVSARLGLSGQSGLNILRQIESLGILRAAEPSAEGRYRWVCDGVLSTVYGER
jgi:Fic family protein